MQLEKDQKPVKKDEEVIQLDDASTNMNSSNSAQTSYEDKYFFLEDVGVTVRQL